MEFQNVGIDYGQLENATAENLMMQVIGTNLPIIARDLGAENVLELNLSRGYITLSLTNGVVSYEGFGKNIPYKIEFLAGAGYPAPFVELKPIEALKGMEARTIILYGNNSQLKK